MYGGIAKLILIVGGVLLWVAAKSGKQLSELEVEDIQAAKLDKLISESAIYIDLAIKNPNPSKITFNKFVGDLFYKDKIISKINIQQNIDLVPEDVTVLKNIKAKINSITILNELLKVSVLKDELGSVLLKGNITANGVTFPVTESFELTI